MPPARIACPASTFIVLPPLEAAPVAVAVADLPLPPVVLAPPGPDAPTKAVGLGFTVPFAAMMAGSDSLRMVAPPVGVEAPGEVL